MQAVLMSCFRDQWEAAMFVCCTQKQVPIRCVNIRSLPSNSLGPESKWYVFGIFLTLGGIRDPTVAVPYKSPRCCDRSSTNQPTTAKRHTYSLSPCLSG